MKQLNYLTCSTTAEAQKLWNKVTSGRHDAPFLENASSGIWVCGGRNKAAEHMPANTDVPVGIKVLAIIFNPSDPILWRLKLGGGGSSWGAISHVDPPLDPPHVLFNTISCGGTTLSRNILHEKQQRCLWINLWNHPPEWADVSEVTFVNTSADQSNLSLRSATGTLLINLLILDEQ